MIKLFVNVLLICLSGASSISAEVAEGRISAADPSLVYVGRFDWEDPMGPRCAWSASSISFTVSGGGSVQVWLNDEKGKNFWQVVIDGEATKVLELQQGEQRYLVTDDLPAGSHLIELVKRTEYSQGMTQVTGIELDGGVHLEATPAGKRRIEVIGDSISCGYGNESPSKEHKFKPATENAWMTYGAIAARAVDADLMCIAWSGKKMWPDNTIAAVYNRVVPASKTKWDFSHWIPDVVVINLGTNDFNYGNPDPEGWIAGYVEFIRGVQARYPDTPIYCAVGPMISNWPGERKPRETILGHFEKILAKANVGDGAPVRLIDFGVQAQHHGIGADWHPSVKTHSIMGGKLADALTRDLGW